MSNKDGDFIWYELITDDAEAAQTFYSAVLGWTFMPRFFRIVRSM